MFDPAFILAGVLNGLLAGGVYVLVAVGLTLIYGVLHIINFAHGSLLMLCMYAVFFLWKLLGLDPYMSLPLVVGGAFVVGFLLYRGLIGRFSHGRDENILLITLGVSIVADNGALLFFGGNTETVDVPYAGQIIELGVAFLPLAKVISFGAALVICLALGLFTRVAALLVGLFMVNAIWSLWAKGFFWTAGGWEYSLLILAVSLVFMVRGGGNCSLDSKMSREF